MSKINVNEELNAVNKEIKENQNLINKLEKDKSSKSLGLKIQKHNKDNDNLDNIENEECVLSDIKRTHKKKIKLDLNDDVKINDE